MQPPFQGNAAARSAPPRRARGRVPDGKGLSPGLSGSPGAARLRETRGGRQGPPWEGWGPVLCPHPNWRVRPRGPSPGRPRSCVPAAAATAAAAAAGGEGERRQLGHSYSGTKMRGAGTKGASERNPPPAAPCWKRAVPGRPQPPRPSGRDPERAHRRERGGHGRAPPTRETPRAETARGHRVTGFPFPTLLGQRSESI